MKITIKQHLADPARATAGRAGNLVILVQRTRVQEWDTLPQGAVVAQRLRRQGGLKPGAPFFTQLPNAAGTRLALAGIDEQMSGFELLTLARKLVGPLLEDNPGEVTLWLRGLPRQLEERAADAVAAAVLAAAHVLPSYKSRPPAPRKLTALHVYGLSARIDLRRTEAGAAGNNLARDLTIQPPNHLTPAAYRRQIQALARREGWRMRFYGVPQLKRLKAGAFLAVTQGSAVQDAGIVHLRYRPAARRKGPRLALVGKGICFDTGGLNLKTARHMHGMHEDMAGSAVALGTLLALTRLKVPYAVDCWLALAQNQIGPNAYQQNDVVRACDGTTIEVVHTDAEGRMVLADTLALARRAKPDLMIDYATLTGTCLYALSTRYSGAFTNRPQLHERIIAAGRDSGERLWPFPMDADFGEALESQVADIKQCLLEGEADHILGANFLGRFAGDTPWLHLDLASANHKGGLGHVPTDITGFGVRFTLALLSDPAVWRTTQAR